MFNTLWSNVFQPTDFKELRFILGIFIVNVVLRDESLRPKVIDNLKSRFNSITSYKLNEDLNEVFICSVSTSYDSIRERLGKSTQALNNFFKRKNMKDECISLDEFIQDLKINS